jgi:Sulfotransferase family
LTLPTFLIIGAANAGTTALHSYLRQHEDIYLVADPKEPNFYALAGRHLDFKGPGDMEATGTLSVTDRRLYEQLFEGRGSASAWGEASTLYLYSAEAPVRIRELAPETRLIVMLRDPAARTYSHWLHMRLWGREPLLDIRAALAAETERKRAGWEDYWQYRGLSRYAEQLERYLELFRPDQIRVYLFDDLAGEAGRILSDICAFIGVRDDADLDVSRRHNPSGILRSSRLHRLMHTDNAVKSLARAVVPARLRTNVARTLYYRNIAPAPPLEAALRAELVAEFEEDISYVEELTARDLTSWRSTDPSLLVAGAGGARGSGF